MEASAKTSAGVLRWAPPAALSVRRAAIDVTLDKIGFWGLAGGLVAFYAWLPGSGVQVAPFQELFFVWIPVGVVVGLAITLFLQRYEAITAYPTVTSAGIELANEKFLALRVRRWIPWGSVREVSTKLEPLQGAANDSGNGQALSLTIFPAEGPAIRRKYGGANVRYGVDHQALATAIAHEWELSRAARE